MSKSTIAQYYPVKKKFPLEIKDEKSQINSQAPDYSKFLACNKNKFNIPLNLGPLPTTPYRKSSIPTWVYPGSKGFREYQFVICRTCLFYNTLVCLPTGLGKTFIAATVMYNYWRWFKEGLVFFLAPTKPLVDQQYNAFIEIIKGFDAREVGQLTGKQSVKERKKAYETARVFFMTPQTLDHDIANSLLDKNKITCIIIDEAHRATGNYAYCKIVKYLSEAKVGFRIIALSATPGPDVEAIQKIITNLCISKVEVRSDDDPDVKPYTHVKDIELVRVEKTSEIVKLQDFMLKIIAIPQSFLQNHTLLPRIPGNKPVNKMIVLEAQQKFIRTAENFTASHGPNETMMVYACFSALLSLLCGLSMLLTHGMESLRAFCARFKGSVDEKKSRKAIINTQEFKDMEQYLEDISKDDKNHPKLAKMKELLSNFFQEEAHKKSQAIIFTLFVDSAREICKFLADDANISASIFIGQANGYTQKEQMRIINSFKAHNFNTLVATCIGEEGLDIGYVDLILSYDCTGSPVRMIQRFGRTGRQQEGKVIILLSDDEERRYNRMKKASKNVYDVLKNAANPSKRAKNAFTLYEFNPRMIEENINPTAIYATNKEEFGNLFAFDKKSSLRKSGSQPIVSQKGEEEKKYNLPHIDNFTEFEESKISVDLLGKEDEKQENLISKKESLSEELLAGLLENSQLFDSDKKTTENSSINEDLLELFPDLISGESNKKGREEKIEIKTEKKFKYEDYEYKGPF